MSTLRTSISYQRRRWEATILGLGGEYGRPPVSIGVREVARGRRMAKRGIPNPQGRRPLRSKVRVFTWLSRPCGANFFPLNEISTAPTLPVLITIWLWAWTDFSAAEVSVSCITVWPSAVMLTHESSRALINTVKAPAFVTAPAAGVAASGEPAEDPAGGACEAAPADSGKAGWVCSLRTGSGTATPGAGFSRE